MYERSGVVLEKYFNELFGLNKKYNLEQNFKNYNDVVKEMQNYQIIVEEEEKIIEEFEKVANKIRQIQKEEEKIYKINIKLEDKRNQLFNSIDEEAILLERKIEKIEENLEENHKDLKELKIELIQNLSIFLVKQKERNTISRKKRTVESNHIAFLEQQKKALENIDLENIRAIKNFIDKEDNSLEKELIKKMIDNGKSEKVGFNQEVINKSVEIRKSIAKREAKLYITGYDKLVKLFNEIENDNIKLNKHQKIIRDTSIELAFFETQKEYIIGFLDNERMTSINGTKAHKEIMKEACQNFEEDITQINNLYELIQEEISGRVTKKAYKELFNKTYLKNIEQKEINFEEETNNIKLHTGTIINSNYWRIEGIKNMYEVFQEEVSQKLKKDLSEYKIEEDNQIIEEKHEKKKIQNENIYEIEVEIEKNKEEDNNKENTKYEIQIEEDEEPKTNEIEIKDSETQEIDEEEEIGTVDFVEKIRKNNNKKKKNQKEEKVEKQKKKENTKIFNRIFKVKEEKNKKHS